jgi:hypothetical protein
MKYIIEEIYEINCDVDKILTVQFKIEGDGEGYYRELLDSEYYDWCNELYLNDGNVYGDLETYEDDDDGYYDNRFNIDIWNMYYSNEENVIDFIYETYSDIKSLPTPKNEN